VNCPNCGEQIKTGDQYCAKCGHSIGGISTIEKKNRPQLWSTAAILSLTWGIIGCIRALPIIFLTGCVANIAGSLSGYAYQLGATSTNLSGLISFLSILIPLIALLFPVFFIAVFFSIWNMAKTTKKFAIGVSVSSMIASLAVIILYLSFRIPFNFGFFNFLDFLFPTLIIVLLLIKQETTNP
jgi:hypothetical protein